MNNLIKKGVVVAVVLLFIGLAFAPSINANVSKTSVDNELVEFTTEVCGLKGGKQTVRLTKTEAEEVEQLIDNIESRLNAVETRKEAIEIFNEAVVELDKYGLLGGLSVKQAQRLVCGKYYNVKVLKTFAKSVTRNQNSKDINLLCFVSGTHDNYYISRIFRFHFYMFLVRLYLKFKDFLVWYLLDWSLEYLWMIDMLTMVCPIQIGKSLYFTEAGGNISAVGILGKNHWEGNIIGGFQNIYVKVPAYVYLGCIGFTGLHIVKVDGYKVDTFFFGYCLIINLKEV